MAFNSGEFIVNSLLIAEQINGVIKNENVNLKMFLENIARSFGVGLGFGG